MPGQELYRLCLHATITFLKKGVWKSCVSNPFSKIPPKIISDLWDNADSRLIFIHELFLILTSGQLQKLDYVYFDDRCARVLVQRNGCRNFRSLFLYYFPTKKHMTLLKDLLLGCTKLEFLQTSEFFDLALLENCPDLKCLRCDVSVTEISIYLRHVSPNFPECLKNLELFSPTDRHDCFTVCGVVETILLNCPKLISVGKNDTLIALSNISRKCTSPKTFQLRRCFWGFRITSTNPYTVHTQMYPYTDKEKVPELKNLQRCFAEMTQAAVLCCPDVEDLIIDVFDEDSLQFLPQLKKLTFLQIRFHDFHLNASKLTYHLSNLGSQIKHLSIERSNTLEISAICDCFPNLESLQVIGPMCHSIPCSRKICPNLRNLKRLNVRALDESSLLFLFSNCLNLTELYIQYIPDFPDALLRLGTLSKLEKLGIYYLGIDAFEIIRILDDVASLEIFSMGGSSLHSIRRVKANYGVKCVSTLKYLKDEFFHSKLNLYEI